MSVSILVRLKQDIGRNNMTTFNKENFEYHGGYLTYTGDQGEFNQYFEQPCHPTREGMRKDAFIARFKYVKHQGTFKTFLIKHFTVEEYFGRIAADEAPLTILESKGYVMPHIKKWLKADGYPQTQAGYKAWSAAQAEKRRIAAA